MLTSSILFLLCSHRCDLRVTRPFIEGHTFKSIFPSLKPLSSLFHLSSYMLSPSSSNRNFVYKILICWWNICDGSLPMTFPSGVYADDHMIKTRAVTNILSKSSSQCYFLPYILAIGIIILYKIHLLHGIFCFSYIRKCKIRALYLYLFLNIVPI